MAGAVPVYVLYIVAPILITFLFPFLSWAIGRWYQDRLHEALLADEKKEGSTLQDEKYLSTSSQMDSMSAQSSTLLHVSICVGPSIGQMFFMWVKGLFGGRLHSYDVVLDYGRREVLLRLKRQANELGCSSIQNIRIETSMVRFAKNNKSKQASVEFLAFATGIRQ